VDLTPDGFSAGGSPLPVPVAKTLTDSLRQAGIDIAVLPASETPTSVVAAAVQITRHQDFGPSGNGGSIALILGQSSVSLTGAPQQAVSDGGLLPLLTAPPPVPAPQASSGGGAADVPSTTSATSVTPLAPPAAAPAAPSAPVVTAPTASTRRPVAERIDAAPVYWLIVAVAAIAAAAGPLVRLVAARARSAS
jgi:hypothetical protein